MTFPHTLYRSARRAGGVCSRRILRTLLLLSALVAWTTAEAQTFRAKVEDAGGYYRLSFTVTSSDAENFTPPSLEAFEVLSGPSQYTSSNYQIINGHASSSSSTTYTYILAARKSGRATIGPATVHVGGKTLRSNAVTFNAQANAGGGGNSGSARGSSGSGGGDGYSDGVQQAGSAVTQRDLFIDVTPSRTRVREQEAVLLTYRIHARVGVGLSNTSLSQKPDFKGIISQEIPLPGNQIQTSVEHRGGTTYRTGTILQYLIFPQKSGVLTIPSITFDCAVIQQDRTMDLADIFFNGGGTIGVQVKRTVPVLRLNVEALPQPRPANFSGAVGKFSIEGKMLSQNVRTNDVATYRITLNGLGNLKLVSAPKVNFPADFDTYDAKTTDNTKVTKNGLNGQLVFDYTFVPRNVGKYTIPATEFVFFDTGAGEYRTVRTAPVELNIAKGERSNADVDKQLALLKSDIHAPHAVRPASLLSWGGAGLWALFALCLVLIAAANAGLSVWLSRRGDTASNRRQRADSMSRKRLRVAQRILQGKERGNFHEAVSRALFLYVADSCNVPLADLSADTIRSLFAERQVPAELIDRFSSLIDRCQYAQYANAGGESSAEAKQQTIAEAMELISAVQKAIHSKKQ